MTLIDRSRPAPVRRLRILALAAAAIAALNMVPAARGERPAHPGSGYKTYTSPGVALSPLSGHSVLDLVALKLRIDPTRKFDAVEYHEVLTALEALHGGTAWAALPSSSRTLLERVQIDAVNWAIVNVLPLRDDPVYVVDEDRPVGPIKPGPPRTRRVPLLEVAVTKLPQKAKVFQAMLVPVKFIQRTEGVFFRVMLPAYGYKPDGSFRTEPLRYVKLDRLPPAGTRELELPVDAGGEPLLAGVPSTGGSVSLSDLARRDYDTQDLLLSFDNRTAARLPAEQQEEQYVLLVDFSRLLP